VRRRRGWRRFRRSPGCCFVARPRNPESARACTQNSRATRLRAGL
jgi:hypothetical protein